MRSTIRIILSLTPRSAPKLTHGMATALALSLLIQGLPGQKIPGRKEGERKDVAAWVDPFIGTGGHGHTFPGATRPFGMVQLSPDTRLTGWDGCSGYHDSDRVIFGFSHTHLSGTGVSDYGDILLMPTTSRDIRLDNGAGKPAGEGYKSRFDKKNEMASPGYYRVKLDDSSVDVELTATARVGLHRYRYAEGKPQHLILDLVHRDRVTRSSLRLRSTTEIEGERWSRAWARDQRVFFVARFSRPFNKHFVSMGLGQEPEARTPLDSARLVTRAGPRREGDSIKAWFRFEPSGEPLLVAVGISATSIEGARRNLDAELQDWDFDRVRREARAEWTANLGRIQIGGASAEQSKVFYTSLYHSMLAPNLFSDVDGRYRGLDGKTHQNKQHDIYTVFSLWDTFRATHPLFTILEPKRTEDFLQSFLAHYREGGRLPVWELAGNETDCMIGYHAVSVIADALTKGIGRQWTSELAKAAQHSADIDQRGQDAYKALGYIPSDHESESVSKTLEYAYDDWCLSRILELDSKPKLAQKYARRSRAWRHLFDPATGFLRARANGGFREPFEPREVNQDFTEANCWQYSFFAPHDIEGLILAHGGREGFAKKLDDLFSASELTTGRRQADITGLIGQYAHGNEPSHHIAWLYTYAGQPWKTQRLVRQILDTLYAPTPDGLCGNEDCGQMSSWYVLSAIGFYPVAPGKPEYVLGAPRFPKVEILLPGQGPVRILAPKVSTEDLYVQSVQVNGEPWNNVWIPHSLLAHPGKQQATEIRFDLDSEPGTWGTRPETLPLSRVDLMLLPAPILTAASQSFRKNLVVDMRTAESKAQIRYTTDGSQPAPDSTLYEKPITLTRSTTLRAITVLGDRQSSESKALYVARANDWKIQIAQRPSKLYTAGGPQALIDGIRGKTKWRIGNWQGYQRNFEATIDFGEPRILHRISAGFLQDQGAWILLPKSVEFATSLDGKTFQLQATLTHNILPTNEETLTHDFTKTLTPTRARYLRIRATNFGRLPPWHLGAGGNAWIFIDEILAH